jgi:hypothetical protein
MMIAKTTIEFTEQQVKELIVERINKTTTVHVDTSDVKFIITRGYDGRDGANSPDKLKSAKVEVTLDLTKEK